MELRTIETNVTPEVNDIGVAVKKIMINYKEATKDGFQAGQDIPAILMGSYQDLLKAIEDADKVGEEFNIEPFKASIGVLVPVSEGLEVLLKKDEQ